MHYPHDTPAGVDAVSAPLLTLDDLLNQVQNLTDSLGETNNQLRQKMDRLFGSQPGNDENSKAPEPTNVIDMLNSALMRLRQQTLTTQELTNRMEFL